MPRSRGVLTLIAVAGLAASTWDARPADLTHLPGWRTAVLWASAAWMLLLAVIVPWLPVSGVVAALLMAGVVELIVLFVDDPMLSAAKPVYQVPALLACACLALGSKPDTRR